MVWAKTSTLQVNIQKVIRYAKKLPEKSTAIFLKELNKVSLTIFILFCSPQITTQYRTHVMQGTVSRFLNSKEALFIVIHLNELCLPDNTYILQVRRSILFYGFNGMLDVVCQLLEKEMNDDNSVLLNKCIEQIKTVSDPHKTIHV